MRLDCPCHFTMNTVLGGIMAYTTNDIAAVRVAVGFGTMPLIDAVIMGAASLAVMGNFIDWRLTFWSVAAVTVYPG